MPSIQKVGCRALGGIAVGLTCYTSCSLSTIIHDHHTYRFNRTSPFSTTRRFMRSCLSDVIDQSYRPIGEDERSLAMRSTAVKSLRHSLHLRLRASPEIVCYLRASKREVEEETSSRCCIAIGRCEMQALCSLMHGDRRATVAGRRKNSLIL